jgi:hypothetical protein
MQSSDCLIPTVATQSLLSYSTLSLLMKDEIKTTGSGAMNVLLPPTLPEASSLPCIKQCP